MKKYKELLQNIGLLTISNFGSKVLIFLLVPLYTAILTTEEYGNFDFIYVTISLLIPLLTFNISDGAMRFLLDRKNNSADKKKICYISYKYQFISFVIIFSLATINYFFPIFKIFKEFYLFFILYYISTLLYQSFQNLIRGYDKLVIIAIGGIINSVLILGLNILFLLVFKWGLKGYFLANILANFLSFVYLCIYLIPEYKKANTAKMSNINVEKEMLEYSKPLMLNSIGWWINNVSDRYLVTYFCGIAVNGIYSVAYKIPSLLSILQSIFNQAWTIFAVKQIDVKKNNEIINNVYILYNIIMVLSCSLLIVFSRILAKFMYLKEFYEAYNYMPLLTLSVVFGALSGLIGGLFSAEKDSKIMGKSTLLGAGINIIFNLILIPLIGAIGAAIATCISYFSVWLIRIVVLNKNYHINLFKFKDFFVYFLLVLQILIVLFIKSNINLLMNFIILVGIVILYLKPIKYTIMKLLNVLKKRSV